MFISLRVRKCGFTYASRAEIRIFTPRDIKFRTIRTIRIIFLDWRLSSKLDLSSKSEKTRANKRFLDECDYITRLRFVLQTRTCQKTFHRTRIVMYYYFLRLTFILETRFVFKIRSSHVGFAEFNNTADNRANIGGTIIGAPIVGQ